MNSQIELRVSYITTPSSWC